MRLNAALVVVLGLTACVGSADPPDLTQRLSAGEVVAGVVVDESALFGGSAAEGQVGDLLIQNDRARFVIQAARDDGSYYEDIGGNVIDADVVRPDGQPGRDMVDEWAGMYGVGRLARATTVEVVDDGRESGTAVVRATGVEDPLSLFTGVAENPDLVPNLGIAVVTDYILRPDTPLLEVTTTLSVTGEPARVAPGDLLQGGMEGLDAWDPGVGFDGSGDDERRFTAYVGTRNELAYALVPAAGETAQAGGAVLLSAIGDLLVAFRDAREITPGDPLVFTRYYGVGSDLADITDAVLTLDGTATTTVSDVVTSELGPVAGARVHILVDGAPFTIAVTDGEGRFSVQVPEGADVTVRASGSLDGIQRDLPAGWAPTGPYAAPTAAGAAVRSLSEGATPVAAAQGYGLASVDDPLALRAPANLVVRSDDGLPFEVRVYGAAGERDPRLVKGAPADTLALAWSVDGEVELAVPPGEVRVEVHRGIRFERDVRTVNLQTGTETRLDVSLAPAYTHEGWLLGDPHSHAAPSPDGLVMMEDRLLSSAAVGLQVHFGTDHDHIVDYRPLIEPLGLGSDLRSVVAEEVSPVIRGHMNAYPVERDPSAPNGGAVRWWTQIPESTESLVDDVRAMGPSVFVQANHPLLMGVASAAGWRSGSIGAPDRWTERIDIVEVDNAGEVDRHLDLVLDLVSRGYAVTPVSVSDSHGPTSGGLGLNATFFGTGGSLEQFDDQVLVETLGARRTIASRGPFLAMDVAPGSRVVGGTEVTVEALHPSWIKVDRLILMRGPDVAEVVQGTRATFSLRPDSDDVYTIIAEGDTPMGGPYGSTTPWAMASPITVDVAGDGWTAPLPALEVR